MTGKLAAKIAEVAATGERDTRKLPIKLCGP